MKPSYRTDGSSRPLSYHVRIQPARGRGLRFSRVEVVQILIAIGALTLAFAIILMPGGLPGFAYFFAQGLGALLALVLGIAFVAVVTAFLLHELAHKAVAQRYGCYAEFRYYPMGLLLGILTAALGFIFAAPGAVMISGPVSPRQHVRISAVGPGTNLAIAAAFMGLAVAVGPSGDTFDITRFLVQVVAFVNLFLGGFNLIPFGPLDGQKIFAYDKVLWAILVAILVGLGVAGWQLGFL